jgi:hypothetical protein
LTAGRAAAFTVTGTSVGSRSRPGTGAHRGYRTISAPKAPRVPVPTLIGIFLIVVAVVVTVGRVAIRHQIAGNQSSSAKSVSTSK